MGEAEYHGHPHRRARQHTVHTLPTHRPGPWYNPMIPDKDARRVLDWQADVARETAALQDAAVVLPPPPPGPPPALGAAIQAANPHLSKTLAPQRSETYPRLHAAGPAGTGTATSSESQDVASGHASVRASRSPRLIKQETVTRHFRGPPSGSSGLSERFQRTSSGDHEYRYRIRQASRGRRSGDSKASGRSVSRSTNADRDRRRDGSRGWREEKKRYTHYVIPTAEATGAVAAAASAVKASHQIMHEAERARRKHYSYPLTRRDEQDEDEARAQRRRRDASRRRHTRSYSRGSSSRRSPSVAGKVLHEQLRRGITASPVAMRDRTPPPARPRPTSYASHGSSVRRNGAAGTAAPAGPANNGHSHGITTIRVIPRDAQPETLAWEREMARQHGGRIDADDGPLPPHSVRDTFGPPMPPPVPQSMMHMPVPMRGARAVSAGAYARRDGLRSGGPTTSQRLDGLVTEQRDGPGTAAYTSATPSFHPTMAGANTAPPAVLTPEERLRMHIDTPASPPPDAVAAAAALAPAPTAAAYAPTLLPSDSISSAGERDAFAPGERYAERVRRMEQRERERERERARLRDRMGGRGGRARYDF